MENDHPKFASGHTRLWARARAILLATALILLSAACATPVPDATPPPASPTVAALPATSTTIASPAATEPTITEGPPPASPTIVPQTSTSTALPPPTAPEPTATEEPSPAPPTPVTEAAVTLLPLSGPLTNRSAEVSGMAWYGDHLIILPQYPGFSSSGGDGALYALPRSDILAYLNGSNGDPLEPQPVTLNAPGLSAAIRGFEGFEAIAFDGDNVYLTIEASPSGGMRGYLVSGQISADLSELTLDTGTLTEILPQADLGNMTDETLVVAGDQLLTLYEANGANVNASPMAHLFEPSLAAAGTMPFPTIEYRITDATALDAEQRFWAINYFYPGDTKLKPGVDAIAEQYGQGPSHATSEPVERLVEFQVAESTIILVDRPPIQLELLPDDARNWEGLVRLDDLGFLLMTDTFPETLLGFVPLPSP